MKLYHVTFDLNEPDKKLFYPRVPKTAGTGEDKSLKRICLAPTIEECMQALPSDKRKLRNGEKFRIYEVEIDDNDPNLVYPEEIFNKGYVPDALENHEFWYKENLLMDSIIVEIQNFNYDYEIAWSCVKLSDLRNIVKELSEEKNLEEKNYLNKILSKNFSLPEDLYKEVSDYINYIKDFDFCDDLWEAVASLPWAQLTKINSITWKVINKVA